MELCDDEEVVPCGLGQIREVSGVQSEAASGPGIRRLSRDHQPGTQTVSDSPSVAAASSRGTLRGHPQGLLPQDGAQRGARSKKCV